MLVGPQHGVDVGVVRVADGVAMALTADPVFVVPAYGWERAAWFAVHILASDASTSGLPLRWMSVDLNLPRRDPTRTSPPLGSLPRRLRGPRDRGRDRPHGAVRRLRLADGGRRDLPRARGRGRFVTPTMARPGDAVVVTKGAAIERRRCSPRRSPID